MGVGSRETEKLETEDRQLFKVIYLCIFFWLYVHAS